jgi:integrase
LVKPRDFFGALQLSRMSGEDLQSYREHRSQAGVGPAYINMEVGTICRILKRARRWHLMAADLRPLKERRRVGRALSPDEKHWLLRVAGSRPEWQIARYAAILALNTTMRGCELKGLRWRDVSLIDATLNIQRSKTEAGERVIPLNNDAMAAVLGLYKRAQGLEATDMNHFVFPACENGKIDPNRQQETWRTAWRKLTRAVQYHASGELQSPSTKCANDACGADIHELKSPLAELRFHNPRHHAITELAESQASEQTIMSIAGHVSPKMLAHYSHVRLDAKRRALEALSREGKDRYVTNHVTNQLRRGEANTEVIEKYGRPVRARTADLHRVKVAL